MGLRSAILLVLVSVLATTVSSGALGTDRSIAEPLATVRAERPNLRHRNDLSSWLGPDNTSTWGSDDDFCCTRRALPAHPVLWRSMDDGRAVRHDHSDRRPAQRHLHRPRRGLLAQRGVHA